MKFEELKDALKDINLCNQLLGGDNITTKAVWKLVQADLNKSYTILDVGCGDGTMLLKLSNFLSDKGISHTMVGVDLRDDVLAIAKQKTNEHPNIGFRTTDILEAGLDLSCDILISTLTMHHFEDDLIDIFLKKFVDLASIGVVINDLHRSKLSYFLFKVFGLFFLRTTVAKNDGLVSIRRGFKRPELLNLAKKIPNVTHHIQWKWAFRYVWVMKFNRHIN